MNSSKHINTFFSLSLLLVFVVCAFMLLLLQIREYQSVHQMNEFVDATHIPKSYILNKVRLSESYSKKEDVLILHSGKMDTYIYQQDGYLCEFAVVSGYESDLSLGEKLFPCDSFEITESSSLLKIDFEVDGIRKDCCFRNRKGEFE